MDLSDLSGTEYQDLVFNRLVEKLFNDRSILTMENHPQGAVDYVVRERLGEGMLSTKRFHYFECKNYSRPLELDNVAKIMVVAVAEQPTSVNVVSRTRLQPQIKRYASRLFDVGGDELAIFKSVAFRHWLTDEIVQFKRTDLSDGHGPKSNADGGVWWWITECNAFSETEVASAGALERELLLRHGAQLLLTIELQGSKPASIHLEGIPRECWRPIAVEQVDGSIGKHTYLIDAAVLDAEGTYALSVRMMRNGIDSRTPIGRFGVRAVDAYLPELRAQDIERIGNGIGPSGDLRLVLIDGEAGVGKTRLVEKIAEGLRAKFAFDVMRFTVTEANCETLIGDLALGCLTPPIGRDGFNQVAEAIRTSLLEALGGGQLETNVSILARIATSMGPRVIVLRDCQFLTATVADQIWVLIMALDDASWGGVRLVLEFRQPDGLANPALQSLIHRIRLKIRRVLLEERILPLDERQFSALTARLFGDVTDRLARRLWERTGGLPLFIDSYLRRLATRGLVTKSGDRQPFIIAQPGQVLADDLPVDGQLILEDRVRTWLDDKLGGHQKPLAVSLGLLAIAEDARSQFLMCEALGLSVDDVRLIQTALDIGEIGYGRPDGTIGFRHDLLRAATVAVSSASVHFASRARDVAGKLLACGDAIEVQVRFLRAKIYSLLNDKVALETELRNGALAAKTFGDYRHLISFLTQLLALLKDRSDAEERLDLMTRLAWATWVSDSLLVARERYIQLAEEAERCSDGSFSLAEAVATDAYRRAIGIDLELMEPQEFLKNTIRALSRHQTPITFNSILNRLVLFCAQFGFPEEGYRFAQLAYDFIGDGKRENEGSVLCSELGALYFSSAPEAALELYQRAAEMAQDDSERSYNSLAVLIVQCLQRGRELDLAEFDRLWAVCSHNQLSEPLARASLLRGSLLLRGGDLKSAAHWIARTAAMVSVYHLRQFQLAILNDQILLAVLQGDSEAAREHFTELVAEFDRIDSQRSTLPLMLSQAYESSLRAAATIPLDPSPLPRPTAPPEFCAPMEGIRKNIAILASLLGASQTGTENLQGGTSYLPISSHRQIAIGEVYLVLGAY